MNNKAINTQLVLIVGAGPTGLTAAMELSRMGIKVRIIDKAQSPSSTSRAIAVQSRTVELLQQRGLADEMLARGNLAHATTIYSKDKILGKVDLSKIPSRYNFCLLIPQSDTESLLRNQVQQQGVTIEWNTEMIGFEQLPNQGGIKAVVKLPDSNKEEFFATYLISAEGAHSSARNTLNLSFEGKTMGQNYALGDLHIDGNIPKAEISVFIDETKNGLILIEELTATYINIKYINRLSILFTQL